MAVDSLDTCGIYFGTTGGQVYASADAGDSWTPIVRDLPAVLSVEVADAAMIRVVLPYHLRTLARVGDEVHLRVDGPRHAGRRPRRARSAVPGAARHDPRPCHVSPPSVRALLRLRRGLLAPTRRHAAARGHRRGDRAVPRRRRDGGRLAPLKGLSHSATEDTEISVWLATEALRAQRELLSRRAELQFGQVPRTSEASAPREAVRPSPTVLRASIAPSGIRTTARRAP